MVQFSLVAAFWFAAFVLVFNEGAAATVSTHRQHRLLLARARAATVQKRRQAPATLPLLAAGATDDAVKFALSSAEKGGPAEVEKLEAMVTDLVKKKNSKKDGKATPMDPSVKYIKTTIDTVMLPNRKRAYESDQSTLDRLIRDLQGCSGTRRTLLDAAENKKRAYKSGSDDHKLCRNTEAGDYLEKADRCMDETLEVKRLQKEATCQEVKEAQKCKYVNYKRIIEAEEKCQQAKDKLRTAEEYCESCRSRHEATKSKCTHLQSVMDEAACRYAVAMKEACSSYSECYNQKLKIYDAAEKSVQKKEEARSGEWRALKRMQCLMNAFDNGKVTDLEVDTCKKKTHTPPAIKYPRAPDMERCKVPDTYPSTAAYKEKEFALLPPQAKGKPEAGNCFAMDVL